MFAKTIIDSDAFLDMPLSTQALYFHLSMRADDEGFINNPKKIQRMIGATGDDLKLLNAKNFIIPFESGVVVIKHWKIHNYIRGDRLVETQYKDEKALLTVKENGAYTIAEDIKEIQLLDANDKRKLAYQNSSLPYSFTYKIRRAFEGCTCPSCGKRMTSSYRNAMPTIQHNLPISKGGEHEIDNISVICESCNTSIRDNVTEDFNNAEVIEKWDKIMLLEKQGIKWFDNPEILNNPVDSQMSVTCQSNVSIGKDRLGKDSIGKDSINNNTPLTPQKGEQDNYDFNKHSNLENVKFVLNTKQFKDWEYLKNNIPLWECIKDWMEYKDAKKPKNSNHYVNLKSMNILLGSIVRNSKEYGVDEVINVINTSMSSSYQGIIWDKIKKKSKDNLYGTENIVL